jgi:hypothetical protein
MNIAQKTLAAASLAIASVMPAHAGTIYDVSFNGSKIDLSGFIETNAVGDFSPGDFDSQVLSYSLVASWNGFAPFTFTAANSTWGFNFEGANVVISILNGMISLSAPTGGDFDGGNGFLMADVATNGAQENLRLFQDHLGFRTSDPPNAMLFDTLSGPFVLGKARAIPEPASIATFAFGLMLFGVTTRRATRVRRI